MATLIVRLSWARTGGRFTGIVERVATGEKYRFHDLKGLGGLIDGVVGSKRNGRRRRLIRDQETSRERKEWRST
jgi:hypothetical protein